MDFDSARRAREYASWAEELRSEVSGRLAIPAPELNGVYTSMNRLKLAADLFLSAVAAELPNISAVTKPDPAWFTRDRLYELVADALNMTPEAAHVFADPRE